MRFFAGDEAGLYDGRRPAAASLPCWPDGDRQINFDRESRYGGYPGRERPCDHDPHGDLVENALGFVPKERLDDVIYFNAGDLARPMGMNMLDYNFNRPEEKTFIVNEMINIFDKLYDLKTTGGPMFEQYMRNALLLMMEDMVNEPATLIEVPRIFSDAAYRNRKLARIKNPVVVDFWEKEAIKAGGEASLANMTPYITSKFTSFISNDYMRPIVGQPKSAFNFREAMDSGKILLVNLSKGRIGDLNAQLLGLIITGKIAHGRALPCRHCGRDRPARFLPLYR